MAKAEWADGLGATAELFRTTVENLPINLVVFDRDYRILYLNPALAAVCATISGRSPEELVGRHGFEVFPRPIWESVVEHSERAIATRERQSYELATDLPGRGPSVRAWTVVPLLGPGGEVDRILTMSMDITAQRRMLDELREADQRKSEFIAVLSHELRNPLAAIRLGLQALEQGAPASGDTMRIIDRQIGQLVRLVDDLLDVTRIAQNKIQLQKRRLDLNELVGATIEDNRRHLEQGGVRVEARLAGAAIFVSADPVRIAQVLTNLLSNAVKFTPSGGTTTVSVSVEPGGVAVLRVTDTGTGIEPALLGRLFEPLTQADRTLARSGGGLGLGLVLVKGLVELHGGSVSASSAGKGMGAEFVVHLPLDAEAAIDAQAGLHGRRVLLIEDDSDVATALQAVLEMGGHEVAVAGTGPDGIAAAHAWRPEVVLCDIGLPGMDGYEVARAMRADRTLDATRLVALSGYAQPDDVARARAAGFDEHLAKPPSMDKVNRILAAAPAPT